MEHQKSKSMEIDSSMWQSARLQATGSDQLGQSCRVYCPATARVPFEWEDEPGKPKGSARMDIVPPLCPSPAMQSARLTDRRRDRRRKSKQGAGTVAGFEGCIPLRFHLGRAMKMWA
ncbi:hypothetical protein BAE44_0000505 [Dichanthelium oligosanthes]|uniref:Uncharacterized protein n=1 Tax=Dichanthelium oligosanthes TaxID=888268 RepID=A0A1E5WM48_9POAL|nr:hypothetical protein BAE44_0000505 [Dichanthelium oligosanthes]